MGGRQGRDKDLRDLGRLRLAHVLFDEKALDEALKLLSEEPAQAFATRFNELRGDLLAAQGKKAEARAAYQAALARQAADQSAAIPAGRDTQYRDLLQMKADSLGDK
jgi:predicted negative regulator of RcsB-dependent stress response